MPKNKKDKVVKKEEKKKENLGIQIHFGNAELVKIRLMEANNKLLYDLITEFRKVVEKIEKGK